MSDETDTIGDIETATLPLTANKALWTARVNARSRIQPGQQVELAVDTRSLHFFDPSTGLSIGHRAQAAN